LDIDVSLYPFNITRWYGGTGADEGDNLFIVNKTGYDFITAPKSGLAYIAEGQTLKIREGGEIEITPIRPGITIINKMAYDTWGNWVTDGPTISGDIHSGQTRNYMFRDSDYPFTVTAWGPGSISPYDTTAPNTWYIVNHTRPGSGTITVTNQGGGLYSGVGSLVVNNGDELWLTT
jgi:hypothetical protein